MSTDQSSSGCRRSNNNAQILLNMKQARVLILLLFVALTQGQAQEEKMHAFVSSLMGRMTLDEKIGQLNLPGAGDITTGQAGNSDIAKKIGEGRVGGLFNIKSLAK